MNELDLARAIRDGEAPSPSRCGGAWLIDLRISGTGLAERKDETAYRPVEIWTSAEMLQRAAGLPIILLHPEGGLLDAAEYEARAIGAIVLPFVRGSELRGIGRIFGDDLAAALASGELSTSPGAAVGGTLVPTGGKPLYVEADPTLLDHIAICRRGVWDKGGPIDGIRVDSISTKETTMADETENKTEKSGGEHAEKMDKLLEAVGAVADVCKSLGARMDALEAGGKKEAEAEARADVGGEAPEAVAANHRRSAKADEEARERAERADAQAKADSVFMQLGERAFQPMAGETTRNYRIRLLRHLQAHSKQFATARLDSITDPAVFGAVETAIFADAESAARTPESRPGVLRMRSTTTPTGHRENVFDGDIATWMAPPFRHRARIKSIAEIRGGA